MQFWAACFLALVCAWMKAEPVFLQVHMVVSTEIEFPVPGTPGHNS